MELHDVIIMGAGPAGSTAARILAAAGFDVLIIDKDVFPRDKPCAGWVSPLALNLAGIDPKEYKQDKTLISFSSLVIWDANNVPRKVAFKKTLGYGIIRSEFDTTLLHHTNGASLKEGTRITSLERDTDGVLLNDRFKAPVVIGAGGHHCPVAKKFGEIKKHEKEIVAIVSESRIGRQSIKEHTVYPDIPEIIFNDDGSGYGWYFPKGEYLNIGIGTIAPKKIHSYKNHLLRKLDERGRLPDPERSPLSPFKGHAYKLCKITPRKLVSDRILLVGDAGGMAYNMSGEGIGPAIFSGVAAAETIIAAKGAYSAEQLHTYRKKIYTKFGRPYPASAVTLLSLIPANLLTLLQEIAVGSSVGRREIISKRWFFRD
jgi:geranylgeranyl reductase family protein